MVELNYNDEYRIIQNYISTDNANEGLNYLIKRKGDFNKNISSQDQIKLNLLECIIQQATRKNHENLELFQALEGKLSDQLMIIDYMRIKILTYISLQWFQEALTILNDLEEKIVSIKNDLANLKLVNSLDFIEREALVYKLKGFIFNYSGNTEQALSSYLKGIELADKISDSHLSASMLNSIGNIYNKRGELQSALNYYKHALQIWENLDNKSRYASVYVNIGVLYGFMDNYEQAIHYYKQALVIKKSFDNKFDLGGIYTNMIELLLNHNKTNEAWVYLKELKDIDLISEKPSTIHSLYLLMEGFALKNSKRLTDKFKASANFLEIANNENINVEITSQAIFNLTDIRLLEMKLTQNEEILVEIKPWLSKLSTIAEKQKSPRLLAQTYLLDSKLKILELKFTNAEEMLRKAHEIANQQGLKVLDQLIKEEYDHLTSQEEALTKLHVKGGGSLIERVELTGLDKTLDELINRRFDSTELVDLINQTLAPSVNDSDPTKVKSEQVMENFYTMISNETYLTIIRQFTVGPEIYLTDELKFSKMDRILLGTKIGVFFMTAVGQGNSPNQGLFGPLPFPGNNDYESIVYSCFVNDSDNIDPRANGQSYCLIVLSFAKTFEPYYGNRQYLTQNFENFVRKYEKLQDMTMESLYDLKVNLIK